MDNQYLKPGSLVLPGSAIFSLFFEGTRASYLERVTQKQRDVDFQADFMSKWNPAFERVLADIGNLNQFNQKPTLETWYDIVKRVIRLHQKTKPQKSHKDTQVVTAPATIQADADDFYVYLYDEEDQQSN